MIEAVICVTDISPERVKSLAIIFPDEDILPEAVILVSTDNCCNAADEPETMTFFQLAIILNFYYLFLFYF